MLAREVTMWAGRLGLVVLLGMGLGGVAWSARREPVAGAVAADHPLASAAGVAMLRAGGNAVDAAVAAALTSGVVQPAGSGLGGGGFVVVVSPEGTATALDFRETAPAAASRDMFAGGASSAEGGLAVATPSEALGLVELHERFGRLPLSRVVWPARHYAEEGFTPGAHLLKALEKFTGMNALFEPGYRRVRLARALKALASSHGETFRTGWVADDFVAATQAAGGVLTAEDLAGYTVDERPVLRGSWRGYGVITMPPPSSGGVALLELLGASDGLSADRAEHCTVEAAKHAMARRAATGGDPDFVQVDTTVDAARLDQIRADCGPQTFDPAHYAAVAAPPTDAGTLHISVMDQDGWAVALTTTINTAFGSRVIAPESGIVLNNQMDDFTARPGEPNSFGLVQGESNSIAPGKRPLSSMTPTVVVDAQGRPVLVAGASGGPFIITATFQAIQNTLERGLSPAAAVAAPRWHHQWMPNLVMVEPGYPRDALEEAGHILKEIQGFSGAQVVLRTENGFAAGSDPRKGGAPVVLTP